MAQKSDTSWFFDTRIPCRFLDPFHNFPAGAIQGLAAEFEKMGSAAKNATDAMKDGFNGGKKTLQDTITEQQNQKTETDNMTDAMKNFIESQKNPQDLMSSIGLIELD